MATVDSDLDLILAQQESEFDSGLIQVPILKVAQALTREVQQDEAEPGDFINTLTGESLGTKVEFIVSYYQKGRFAANDESKAFVSFDDVIPEAWAPLVGEAFVGTPFSEHPDAEETYKERVNAKEIEWGKGPLISTTHNFSGYAISSAVEGEDEGDNLVPVRLSLKRTDVPAARRIITLKRATLRNKPFWDVVFELSTERKGFTKGSSYVVNVKLGRKTTDEERLLARELAEAVMGQRVQDNSAEAEAHVAPVEPDAAGGLAV